jgi:hypothetical protein
VSCSPRLARRSIFSARIAPKSVGHPRRAGHYHGIAHANEGCVLEFKGTKSGKPRDVKVPESALTTLEEHRKRQNGFARQFGPDFRMAFHLFRAASQSSNARRGKRSLRSRPAGLGLITRFTAVAEPAGPSQPWKAHGRLDSQISPCQCLPPRTLCKSKGEQR